MKAIVYTQYGSPDVLQFKEVEQPTPGDGEVLVSIQAAATNPADWHLLRGTPFLVRLEAGLRQPKNPILGLDIAGQVVAVGRNVSQFQPGDSVFGDTSAASRGGGFAEYVSVAEDALALKPANVSFVAAAAVPVAAITALQGLRDKGGIQPGQQVLINGASGGVGTFAVQLAKFFGAEVTGVCSTRNLEMVRSIGADHVIDYTQADFTRRGQQYDLIFDAVGNRSVSDYKRALNSHGRCVIAGFTTLAHLFQVILLGAWVSRTGSRQIGLMGTARPNQKDLVLLQELLEAGNIVPVIDRCYPLRETAEALRYLETGHARGKVVITVEDSAP
jgi:NADPH:quinone reductase-like Zn-dependent oxidoreductase